MKITFLAVALAAAAPPVIGSPISFDGDAVGRPPTGWSCGATGKGTPRWTVEADDSAPSRPNVLKQSGKATFPWCVRDDVQVADGSVEAKFKPLAGKEDQAGGVVWRWKDARNYYVARANALEQNVSLYYTIDGSRRTVKYVNAPVSPNTWHTLRAIYKGDLIQVALDGKTYIEVRDTHISGPGKAGVWTKADSVTVFDDFTAAGAP